MRKVVLRQILRALGRLSLAAEVGVQGEPILLSKLLQGTPPGKAVFRAFLGGMRNDSLLTDADEALVAIVRRELSEILGENTIGITVEPEHTQVSRWRRAMAQYAVGHQDRIARITTRLATLPGLRLVGNAYDGIGIPDCIRLGRKAAKEMVALAARQPSAVS